MQRQIIIVIVAVFIMINKFYMTNEATLVMENDSMFSPISQLNYNVYSDGEKLVHELKNRPDVQCIAGLDVPFGKAQTPGLMDYADGVDTVQFLLSL